MLDKLTAVRRLADLLPPAIAAGLAGLLDRVEGLLQGETARVIGYGGAAILWLVAKASGRIPDVSFEDAVAQTATAVVILVSFIESVRHVVYSPATVQSILDEISSDKLAAVLLARVKSAPPSDVTPAPSDVTPAAEPAADDVTDVTPTSDEPAPDEPAPDAPGG